MPVLTKATHPTAMYALIAVIDLSDRPRKRRSRRLSPEPATRDLGRLTVQVLPGEFDDRGDDIRWYTRLGDHSSLVRHNVGRRGQSREPYDEGEDEDALLQPDGAERLLPVRVEVP